MTNPELTHRAHAILRATASGRVRPASLTDTGRGVLVETDHGARGTAA